METIRKIPFSPPDMSGAEIEEVAATLRSGWITTGPRTKLLERRLAAFFEMGSTSTDCESEEGNQKYSNKVVCLGSATSSEELNLRILGIRPGDEVIVPAYTYTSTAAAAIHCGAKVVFADIKKDGDSKTHSPEIDYEKIEPLITDKTKAIIGVDIGGVVCDYEKLFDIAEEKKGIFTPLNDKSDALTNISSRIQAELGRIAVIGDCAHSLGASRVIRGNRINAGRIADFSSFSFHAVKNFTTAEGGAAVWNQFSDIQDSEIYHMYQLLSLHGQSKDALNKTKVGSWEYDIIGPWYKCNMTDIMAAIGLRQMDRYPELLTRREQIVKAYDDACDALGISHLIHKTKDMTSSKHLYLMRIPSVGESQRNEIITGMAEKGVATNVHYKPLPLMTAYGNDCSAYPNAFDYYKNLITLPLHTGLSDEDVEYVTQTLKETVKQYI